MSKSCCPLGIAESIIVTRMMGVNRLKIVATKAALMKPKK
jgi:hypothetical protein